MAWVGMRDGGEVGWDAKRSKATTRRNVPLPPAGRKIPKGASVPLGQKTQNSGA